MGNVELVGEIGINASGDLSIAKGLIDVCVSAGFDYVKFQKRTVSLCYTKEELDTPRESPFGTTTREQKNGIEFTLGEYFKINEYCQQKGIRWFASPWDLPSIEDIVNAGSCMIKIPSALITDEDFLIACRETKKKIVLSTGMSTEDEIRFAVNTIGRDNLHSVLHCTSTYPSKNEELNVSYMTKMRDIFDLPEDVKIGFSNHSPGLMGMATAIALGAEVIETHISLDRASYGSDQASSIEPTGMFRLAKFAKDIPKILGDGVKKVYDSEKPIISKLRRK